MPRKIFHFHTIDPVWTKILTLGSILFLVFLADAILSFWVPNALDASFKNTTIVGLIISFSSVIGLGTDLLLPQIIKGITVNRLVMFAICASGVFTFLLLGSTITPVLILFLSAMAVWGIYYELLGFAQQQFIADSTPISYHPAAWGLLGIISHIAYFLGPLIASEFYHKNSQFPLFFAFLFLALSFILLEFFKDKHKRTLEIDTSQVNLIKEFSHWYALFKHVWPIVIISLIIGLIDSFFWTIGPIFTEKLALENLFGHMFLSFYILPFMFSGFLIAKWGIYKGKKKKAEQFLALGGLALSVLFINLPVPAILLTVIIASFLLSLSLPLVNGVYSDIVSRMGRNREHLIGLSNSSTSLAYIIGPALSGFLASFFGERQSFAAVGIFSVSVAIILLLTTPKKLKLPQAEIKKWD